MPPGIHVDAFARLRPIEKYARVGDGRLVLDLHRRGRTVEWKETLEVHDANGEGGLGFLDLIIRADDRTLWLAVWRINNHAVAKLDVEREASRNLSAIEGASGKLNVRRTVAIPAYLPHWRFVDPETGDLGKHHNDPDRFPIGMSMEIAVSKWCAEELNLELQPPGVRFFRRHPDNKLLPLDAPSLFDKR